MKNSQKEPAANSIRRSPMSCLLIRKILLSFKLLTAVFLMLTAGMVSCRKSIEEEIPEDLEPEAETVRQDTLATHINIKQNCRINSSGQAPIEKVDIFIYRDNALKQLEEHFLFEGLPNKADGSISLDIPVPEGAKVMAMVANSPWKFNTTALYLYESMEQLAIELADEDPSRPLMSGEATFKAGEDVEIVLSPLLCRIVLNTVTNNMSGYRRLEDPRIFLSNVNPSAEVMRQTGFRPSELKDSVGLSILPYDIGMTPQTVRKELFCYPNDGAEATAGNPRTTLVLDAETKGEYYRYKVELPALARNTTTYVNLTVNEAGNGTWECQ